MKRFLSMLAGISLLATLLLPGASQAAPSVTLSLSPTNQTVKVGSEFNATLIVSVPTPVDTFNAIESTLQFSNSKLQVVSISKIGSVLSVWSEEPSFSNTGGTIRFSGGRTSSFSGVGTVLTVKFRAIAVGDAALTLSSGSVLSNDGKGTNLLGLFVPGHYAISDQTGNITLVAGDLIKLPDDHNSVTTVDSAVYYFAVDGLRYVFPNSKTYLTWYSDFNNVKEVSLLQLGTIGLGGNVTYRPGTRMIKIESDPRVFVIERGGIKQHLPSEAVARALYGANWNKMIDDVPDSFYANYVEGSALSANTTWKAVEATGATTSIAADKSLIAPMEVVINTDGTFSPATISVARVRTIRFTNNTSGVFRLASNPHPTHTDLPGFDSAYIPSGLNYVYRFMQTGTFTYHNHADPSKTGTVTVTQ